jgi:3-hydroxymyristoyl/3-hydroxydecanoyl-(acyl carrier protein) dehydratase
MYHGCISPDHPAAPGHFPGNPIVPGVVLLTELQHAIESSLGQSVKILELSSVKFIALLRPGEPFTIHLELMDDCRLKFNATCDERVIASGIIRHTSL